jgi:hypothetical protein
LLDALFVGHAEALLFVDDEQTELLEMDVLGEEAMGADDDVDGAVFEAAHDVGLLVLRLEAREARDLDGILAHAALEREPVLLGEHRRRAENGDLFAALRRAERGADGHLRLAESDVAADEPVHRPRRLEVLEHLGDGARLVGRLVEGERRFERAVVVVGLGDRVAGHRLALRIEAQKLVGHLADLFLDALLRLRKCLSAEPVEFRRPLAAGPLLDLVESVDGQVELVAPGVLDEQEVDGEASDVLVKQALVLADAVLDVHHVIAHGERAQVLEKRLGAARAGAALRAMGAPPEDLFLGDEHETFGRSHDASRERTDHDGRIGGRRVEQARIEGAGAERAGELAVANERNQAFGLRLVARGEQHGKARLPPCDEPVDERIERAVLAARSSRRRNRPFEVALIARRERRRVLWGRFEASHVASVRTSGDGCAVDRQNAARRHAAGDVDFFLVELVERQVRRRALAGGVVLRAVDLVAQGAGDGRRVVEQKERVAGQIVEERFKSVVRGQKPFGAEESAPARHVLDKGARAARREIDLVAQRANHLARPIDGFRRQDRLSHGRHPQLLELARLRRTTFAGGRPFVFARLAHAPLQRRVEGAKREHEVAVELDSDRVFARRRPQVEDRAAHGERAGIFDERHADVAGRREARDELVAIDLLLGQEQIRVPLDLAARYDAAGKPRRGHDQEAPRDLLGEVEQRHEARHGAAPVRVHVGVRARLRRCEEEYVALRRLGRPRAPDEVEVVHHSSCRFHVGGHAHDRPRVGERDAPREQRGHAPTRARDVDERAGSVESADLPGDVPRAHHPPIRGELERCHLSEGGVVRHGASP